MFIFVPRNDKVTYLFSLTHNREYWNAVSSSSANNFYQFGLWTLQSYTSF